jgi:LruC domain-containing protein
LDADPIEAVIDPNDPDIPTTTTTDNITSPIGSGTLAFEDIWSSGGDYDMNDLVVEYSRNLNIHRDIKKNSITGDITSIASSITSITETYKPVFNGAIFNDGFSINYPEALTIDKIKSVEINGTTYTPSQILETYDGSGISNTTVYASQSSVSINIFDDIQDFSESYSYITGKSFTIKINLVDNNGLEQSDFYASKFNPFIIVKNLEAKAGRCEVHLPKYLCTQKGFAKAGEGWNLWYVGRFDGQQYPFAIDIPIKNFAVSLEKTIITTSYPNFAKWVENGTGDSYADWYNSPVNFRGVAQSG